MTRPAPRPSRTARLANALRTPRASRTRASLRIAALLGAAAVAVAAFAHGNVTPQAVDTTGLDPVGEAWRSENPYTNNKLAIEIGSSGFNQNCARCHGLEAISGGIAPDLRRLDNDCATMKDGAKRHDCIVEIDEYFITTVRHGRTRNGAVYMPPFEGVLSQEALWAIKSWLETRREKPLPEAQ
jgi:cytochrome c-550 PedF